MKHSREEVIQRTIREYELLDKVLAGLTADEWNRLVPRPETKDAWTIKDAVAHITHWKADVVRKIRKQRIPIEERGLMINDGNHLIFMRWHDRPNQVVLAWHRKVQHDLLEALREVPEEWFSGKEHNEQWPYDLDGHSSFHRVKDIERAINQHLADEK
jgi:Mycothiol maleylpyruvate isomerase N-terminal domain